MRKIKFQRGGGVSGPSRDVSELSDQELATLIRAEETAQTPYMERSVNPRVNLGLRSRVNPATGAYNLADLRNERRRRQPASPRYAPYEGQPGGEVTEEEERQRAGKLEPWAPLSSRLVMLCCVDISVRKIHVQTRLVDTSGSSVGCCL